jgi:hypothetical protein
MVRVFIHAREPGRLLWEAGVTTWPQHWIA